MSQQQERSLDQKARRAAKCAGLVAVKSRAGESVDNLGGFRIVDPNRNTIEAGERFNMTAEQVIAYCRD
ncbi:hypothetical protein ACFSHT_24040 [Paraburkholderia silviterrae]|uniref:Uncharacterized protein n=1 Tax=Paraburkholderia silviterrae TaxID=2528715 RepID=A0A4V2ZZ76_9BURK|nr:hypothetical protein [Paraburkholderia silviterrae]TDG24033.1 hypothetical protein EYW47_10995 [Paraburkholderia silviterrae]